MSETTHAESTVATVARADSPALLRMLGQLVRNRGLASIADQSLVSLTNFLTMVIIGRAAGQDALGTFSLAFSASLIMLCFQDSLVGQPYTVGYRRLTNSERLKFAGSTLVQGAFLAALLTVSIAVSSMLLRDGSASGRINLPLALAVATPFVLLRDLARRMSLAHLFVMQAVAVDSIVLVLQLGTLLVLWRLEWLSAAYAYLAIAVACAAAGAVWFWTFRDSFRALGQRIVDDVRRGWTFGRWLLGSQVLSVLSTYLTYWIVAGQLGANASGVLAACSAIIVLANPIVFGTSNYLVPRLAAVLAYEGDPGVLRVAVRTTFFLAAVMTLFSMAAFTLGDTFLRLIYGSSFTGNAVVSGLYGLSALAQVTGSAPDYVMWVKNRPDLSFWTGLLGLGCIIIIVLCLLPSWGLMGAVSGMALGNALAAITRWIVALRLIGIQPARNRA